MGYSLKVVLISNHLIIICNASAHITLLFRAKMKRESMCHFAGDAALSTGQRTGEERQSRVHQHPPDFLVSPHSATTNDRNRCHSLPTRQPASVGN